MNNYCHPLIPMSVVLIETRTLSVMHGSVSLTLSKDANGIWLSHKIILEHFNVGIVSNLGYTMY